MDNNTIISPTQTNVSYFISDTIDMSILTVTPYGVDIDGINLLMHADNLTNVTILDTSPTRRHFRIFNTTGLTLTEITTNGFIQADPNYAVELYIDSLLKDEYVINDTGFITLSTADFIQNTSTLTLVQTYTPPFNCTGVNIYAYEKNISGVSGHNYTLNLTPLVQNDLIKEDLTDVWVNESAWINTTGGYYIKVDVSGTSSFNVRFGNYLSNISYNEAPLSENVTYLTNYATLNSNYLLRFQDEFSGEERLPPNATTTLTMYCSLGSSTFDINDTTILLPTFDDRADSFKAKVTYGSDYYIRSRLTTASQETIIFYLVDAYTDAVLQIPIYISDYNFYGAMVQVYKLSGSNRMIMTEGYFDSTDQKFVAYLVRDEPYYIRLESGHRAREVGTYTPAFATSLTLSLNTLSLAPDISYISENLIFSVTNTSLTTIRVSYRDLLERTTSIQILVYNQTNNTAFWNNTYTGFNDINVTINGLNLTREYYTVKAVVTHEVFGNSPVEWALQIGRSVSRYIFGDVPVWIYGVIGFIIMLFISFAITPHNRLGGLVVFIGAFAILVSATWFRLDAGILALIVVFFAVAVVYELKKGGMK